MKKARLLVCWIEPHAEMCEDAVVLSFLPPSADESALRKWAGNYISGRKAAQQVKDQAITLYVDMVARIAATRCKQGKSLREALRTKDGNSLWWYHNVSFKDCEADPTFNHLIQLLAIQKVIKERAIEEIILWGADQPVLNVLKNSGCNLKAYATRKSYFPILFKGLLSRFKYSIINLAKWAAVKRHAPVSHIKPDVVLSGFWDWSVKSSPTRNTLNDRYFKSLPEALGKRGLKVCWLLWFSPHSEPGSRNRGLAETILPARTHNNLIFLHRYLKVKDIMNVTFNFKPLFAYLRFRYQPAFKSLFQADGLQLFALFSSHLLYHFSNSMLPHHELVYKASQQAFNRLRPKFALSFLELFPYSRAFYAGARAGSPKTLHGAIQHASYSREKTHVLLDPEMEFDGKPDHCAVPKPDYIFVMGELGRDIFVENGFPKERVLLTGSPRYEHITASDDVPREVKPGTNANLLMVTSLDKNLEMEMIEAVCLATMDMPQIKLFLRSHPFAKMDDHPGFHAYKNRIQLTDGTLEEDLKNADLVIFSYSTVAEESLMRGLPIWQWSSHSYNASVFRDLRVIPSFCSVSDLRESLERFISKPGLFVPGEDTKNTVMEKCFYKADGKASERIADHIGRIINNGGARQVSADKVPVFFGHNSGI